jgi:hypothetical protein
VAGWIVSGLAPRSRKAVDRLVAEGRGQNAAGLIQVRGRAPVEERQIESAALSLAAVRDGMDRGWAGTIERRLRAER